jgi:hypothetical protein
MKKTEIIDSRFKELITDGEKVVATKRPPPPNVIGDSRVDLAMAQQWSTSTLDLLATVFGRESEYYKQFRTGFQHAGYSSDATLGLAVLKAAWNDYSKGYIVEMRRLVQAEIFDDFLEHATHLLEQGYYQAAAVIAGGVLEDALRKLCDRNGVMLPPKPKLDSMNSELAKKGVYNLLIQKRITALADLRNKAAHAEWSSFVAGDVGHMVAQIRDFVTDYAP